MTYNQMLIEEPIMKLLQNLPIQERITLARKCEPFFLAYKRLDIFKSTFNVISEVVGKGMAKSHEAEIWTLISATTQTIRYDSDSCQLSLNKNNYHTANQITKKNICVNRMKGLIEVLESHNLVELYKGFHFEGAQGRGVEVSMRSLITFSVEWFAMFDVLKCKLHGTAREFDLVILKDKNGKVVSHKGMRGIGDEKKLLKSWNTQIASTKIEINGTTVIPTYSTVFNNGSLTQGGRMYAGSFSTEAHTLRPTIKIAGNPTCEVDYKNNHFRILYNEYGIDFQSDCYAISGQEGWCPVELRKCAKFAGVIMLNANNYQEAVAALRGKMNKEGFETLRSDNKTINYIFGELQKLHSTIQTHFFKGEWARLQNIDSKMAKHIVKAFTVKGLTVLTYHDSFVCESKYKDFLIKMMKEAWELVLGDDKGFDYDVEFDATPDNLSKNGVEIAGIEHTEELIPLEAYKINEEFSLLNFKESEYTNEFNKLTEYNHFVEELF